MSITGWWNNVKFLYNKELWGVVGVFFCFVCVSGQMWNHIWEPPFFGRTKNRPVYIHEDFRTQFLLESYIAAILNGSVGLGMILTIEAVRTAAEGKRRRFQSVVGLVLVCVFFSLLLSVFRAKMQGDYPYGFLFE